MEPAWHQPPPAASQALNSSPTSGCLRPSATVALGRKHPEVGGEFSAWLAAGGG